MRRIATAGLSSLIIILIALMTACNSGYDGYSTPTLSGPLGNTAQAVALERFATQSAAEVRAAQAVAEATVRAVIAAATAQAARQQLEQQWALATAQASQMTAVAEATRQALAATATQQAWEVTITAQARSDAATATAQARSDAATATAQARSDAATATADSYRMTRVAYQATATRQAEQREEILAYGRDFGIPLVLLAMIAGAVYLIAYGIRWLSRRPVVYPRDFRGDAHPLAIPTTGGGFVFVDLDRQPGHITIVNPDGTVQTPQARDPGQEERTTARDQWLDAQTRPLLGAGRRGGQQSATMPLAPLPPGPPGLQRVLQVRRLELLGKSNLLPGNVLRAIEARLEESDDDSSDDE